MGVLRTVLGADHRVALEVERRTDPGVGIVLVEALRTEAAVARTVPAEAVAHIVLGVEHRIGPVEDNGPEEVDHSRTAALGPLRNPAVDIVPEVTGRTPLFSVSLIP